MCICLTFHRNNLKLEAIIYDVRAPQGSETATVLQLLIIISLSNNDPCNLVQGMGDGQGRNHFGQVEFTEQYILEDIYLCLLKVTSKLRKARLYVLEDICSIPFGF